MAAAMEAPVVPAVPSAPAPASRGPVAEAWQRYRRSRLATVALGFVVLLFAIALFAPLLATEKPLVMSWRGSIVFPAVRDLLPGGIRGELRFVDWRFLAQDTDVEWWTPAPIPYSPESDDLGSVLAAPSGRHWLGTDNLGRDVLTRMLHGAGVSLLVGFVAAGLALVIGLFLGALAGWYGGWIDGAISRLVDVVLCFPMIYLVLTVIALLEPSIWKIMAVIGITSWTSTARFVRAEFLRLKGLDYVEAARSMGARPTRIVLRHLLPNSLAPVLVSSTFAVAAAILLEAALSFLGFGVQPPQPSWGNILSQAQQYPGQWWLALFPGLAIFATVVSYNLVGEAFRDAVDPRLREER